MWLSKRNLSFSEHADEKEEQLIDLAYFIPGDIDQPDFITPPGKGVITKIDDEHIEIYFEDSHGNSLTINYEWDDMMWVMKESDYTEWDDDARDEDGDHDNDGDGYADFDDEEDEE